MRYIAIVLGVFMVILSVTAYFLNFRSVPTGFYTDAASNVLNALCLAQTGGDEYGNPWPVAIRAFDDWRPPMLVYLFAAVSYFQPLDLFGARFVSMVLGLVGSTVIVAYLFFSKRLPRARYALVYFALFSMLLLSSWVMVVHRMPVEFVLVLVTVTPMFGLSWKLIERPDSVPLGLLVGFFVGIMPYAYYGTKPLFATQLMLLAWFCYERGEGKRIFFTKCGVWIAALTAFLIAFPAVWDVLGAQKSTARFHSVGNPRVLQWFVVFFKHLDLRMFFFTGDHNLRHHTQLLGVLNLVFLPAYVMGIVRGFQLAIKVRVRYWQYVLAFFFISFLPVSLTNEGIPHSLRTLACLPALVTICFLGYAELERRLGERCGTFRQKLILGGVLGLGLFLSYANVREFQHKVPQRDSNWWTFIPPMQLPHAAVSPQDHQAKTIDERLERVIRGDYRYCGLGSVRPK